MAKKLSYKVSNEEENESYFVSMSDIFDFVYFKKIIMFFCITTNQKPSEENEKI